MALFDIVCSLLFDRLMTDDLLKYSQCSKNSILLPSKRKVKLSPSGANFGNAVSPTPVQLTTVLLVFG